MRRINLALNIILLCAIVALGYLAATVKPGQWDWLEVPAGSEGGDRAAKDRTAPASSESPYDLLAESDYGTPAAPAETSYRLDVSDARASGDLFVHLQQRNIFETIIPKPTPTPVLTPTPVPPPPLSEIVNGWQLQVINGDTAILFDPKNKETINLTQGKDVYRKSYKSFNFEIWIRRIDDKNYKVDLECNYHKGNVYTLSMF